MGLVQRIREAPYSMIEGLSTGAVGALLVGSFILAGPIPIWLGYAIFGIFPVWALLSRPRVIDEEFRGKPIRYDSLVFGFSISIGGLLTLWLVLKTFSQHFGR